jgi:hypothetical protein
MISRMALIVFLALAPVLVHGAELTCANESGPLLVVGSKGGDRLALTQNGREQVLDLERWRICFRCVGFPRLELTFRDSGKDQTWIYADARICDGAGDSAIPEKYCIAHASVRAGNTDDLTCNFPKGTTLGGLWTALTHSPPPANISSWWSYPAR